jgi:DNA (cytosine-5)-methyltransferase 1
MQGNKEDKMFSQIVKQKRKSLGLSQKDFARIIGLNDSGARTIRGWENNSHIPSLSKQNEILKLKTSVPFKQKPENDSLKSIDLFAGIGGIRLGFQKHGVSNVFSSEWDKFAQKTYAANFGELPSGDITQIPSGVIPDHDILLAGFPCQAFSQAGLKQGFSDTRGTLFFEIQRILAVKKPRMFLLENVKQLKGHDKGRTFNTILDILRGDDVSLPHLDSISDEAKKALETRLNYHVDFKVLKSCDFGVPQNRERIYIVGFDKDYYKNMNIEENFNFPLPNGVETRVGQILQSHNEIDQKYTISQKLLDGHIRRKKEHRKKGNGFGFSVFGSDDKYTNTISARYYKDGSEILIDQGELGRRPRKLTPRECARLQGYPEDFIVDAVSDVQAYKQFGNSVSVPVIHAIAAEMLKTDKKISIY